jgi:hypothetical protein
MKLLVIAGFQPVTKSNTTVTSSSSIASASLSSSSSSKHNNNSYDNATLELVHYNPAILTLITQKVDTIVNERKFSKMKNIQSKTPGLF